MRLQSAETLRALMTQRGFSLSRMARYSGCSKSMVSHLCAGRKATCTPQLAERIAEALDVPYSLLFEPSTSSLSGSNVQPRKRAA